MKMQNGSGTRKRYTPEFKAQVVRQMLREEKSIAQLAADNWQQTTGSRVRYPPPPTPTNCTSGGTPLSKLYPLCSLTSRPRRRLPGEKLTPNKCMTCTLR